MQYATLQVCTFATKIVVMLDIIQYLHVIDHNSVRHNVTKNE